MVYSKILYDLLPAKTGEGSPPETGWSGIGWLELIAVSAVLMALFYLFMRVYLKWMYDRHIRDLEHTLADFETDGGA